MDYDVLVVSNYPLVQVGIRRILELNGNFEPRRICEVATGEEAIRTIDDVINSHGRIGVIITETLLPGIDGFELLKHVKINHPGIPVILTPSGDSQYSAEAVVKLGASDYFPKTGSRQELVGKVRSALAKQT